MAIQNKNWTEYTRKQELKFSMYFLEWVDKMGLVYWEDLRFEHLQSYYKHLVQKEMSYDGVRLYLIPIRRTAFWMAANWPKQYVNFGQSFRLSKTDFCSTNYSDEKGNPFLSIHEALDFLVWLLKDANKINLAIGVALQTLVGLQMQEALRLTWEKINPVEGTIIIEGVVKNQFRIRKIPIPKLVIDLLQFYRGQNDRDSNLVVSGYATFVNYSHALRREFGRWKPNLELKPKDLRNTLQTTAIDNGWYGFYVQRYVGHAPTTIGERYYHGNQGWRLIPLYKEHVVKNVEQEIASWVSSKDQFSSNFPITIDEGLHENCTMGNLDSESQNSGLA